MPQQDPPFRRDRSEDMRPSDADRLHVVSFEMGSDDDEYEWDDEDEGGVADPAMNRWLARVMNRHD